jgi:RNA polymerase sigma-70 factor, ECF subfamily
LDKVIIPLNRDSNSSDEISFDDHDDDRLIKLTLAGFERAFDILVTRHQRMALGMAFKYIGDAELARDIAQESFLDLYRKMASYQAIGKFQSYFARIIINRCRMALRRARSEANTQKEFQLQQPTEIVDDIIPIRFEQRRLLDQAMKRLSPKLREVLILRYVVAMSYREISETLGIRIGTVKSRIFSGLEKLARILLDKEDE